MLSTHVPDFEATPSTALALSPHGEIQIDGRRATSLPGVLAASVATTEPCKQILVAMGAGTTAALPAFDDLFRQPAPARTTETA